MATQPVGDVAQWLLDHSQATVARNDFLQQRVAQLEDQLVQWELVCNAALNRAERQEAILQQQLCNHNQQLSGHDLFKRPLILCIINGDEYLFSQFAHGYDGGAHTARSLTENIALYLKNDGLQVYRELSYWITVYYNRRQLLERLRASNVCTPQQFDEFLTGFSVKHPGFSFVDVGGFEETDKKIQEYINTFIRFPQTLRVFFAGRGNGQLYHSLFENLAAERVLCKLVFIGPPDSVSEPAFDLPLLVLNEGIILPMQMQQNYPSQNGLVTPQSPLSVDGGRLIDLSLPLHKQDPPPCNEFYLMTCTKEPSQCKYSHEYRLTPDQRAILATNAKKAPCNWLKNGRQCPHGSKCCWGHVCPNGLKCFHLSKGKCWFKGEVMHSESSAQAGPGM
ncbi:hypothetical protein C8F01DRAFT_592751 [Mycena amicta]|nr:hypothetical protein C8F01DRAFT_592751 [Mycena amicta]